MQRPCVPPTFLVGPILKVLKERKQSSTLMAIDAYPRQYWWPLLQQCAQDAYKVASKGDITALLYPSKAGWHAQILLEGINSSFGAILSFSVLHVGGTYGNCQIRSTSKSLLISITKGISFFIHPVQSVSK